MTDYDVLFYEEQERHKKENIAPHILHKKVNELQEDALKLKKELTDAIARAGTYEDFYKEAVRKLSHFDKEADWLASKIAATTYCVRHKYCSKKVTIEDCKKCWREAARRAVKNDCSCK